MSDEPYLPPKFPETLADAWLDVASDIMVARRTGAGVTPPGDLAQRAAQDADALMTEFLVRFPDRMPR